MAVYLCLNWKLVFVLKSGKNNVFDLAEVYLYLIPKCVFGPNPAYVQL